jgi:hypothetical protein
LFKMKMIGGGQVLVGSMSRQTVTEVPTDLAARVEGDDEAAGAEATRNECLVAANAGELPTTPSPRANPAVAIQGVIFMTFLLHGGRQPQALSGEPSAAGAPASPFRCQITPARLSAP